MYKLILKKKNTIFFLLLFWVLSTIIYIKQADFGVMTLDEHHSVSNLGFSNVYEMFTGDYIKGKFDSTHPNLGIIEVRFNTHNRINQDVLEFKLKESGQENWYYIAKYKTDQFQPQKLFPFGFPIIHDSKGKSYQFEITSLEGTASSAVSLNGTFPPLLVRHIFDKEALLNDPIQALIFFKNKIINLISDSRVVTNSLVYLLPLIVFILFQWFDRSILMPSVVIIFSVISNVIFGDIEYSLIPLSVLFAWIMTVSRFKLESLASAYIGLCFLVLVPAMVILGQDRVAENSAIWAYLFLTVASLQQLGGLWAKQKRKLSIKEFWRLFMMELKNTIKFFTFVINGEIDIYAKTIKPNSKEASQFVELMVYRSGRLWQRTIISTSRLISVQLIVGVKIIKLLLDYGPHIVLIVLLYMSGMKLTNYYRFYQEFFLFNQTKLFWSQIGNILLVLDSLIIFLFLIVQRKHTTRRKVLTAIVFIFFTTQVNHLLFIGATPYRDHATVLLVSPNDTSEPWVDVTITGRNFKEMPFNGTVEIDGVPQRIIRWGDRKITFRTDPYSTKSGHIIVNPMNSKPSDKTKFQYSGNR